MPDGGWGRIDAELERRVAEMESGTSEARVPVEDLVHGKVYRISARNFGIGVWNAERKAFIGVRTKWGSRYLFPEYEWDSGGSLGTAWARNPLEGVELPDGVGIDDRDEKLFEFLDPIEREENERWRRENDA